MVNDELTQAVERLSKEIACYDIYESGEYICPLWQIVNPLLKRGMQIAIEETQALPCGDEIEISRRILARVEAARK